MWYKAHLLFAQRPKKGRRRVLCESCHVLLRASSALKCYDRALTWGRRHEKEGDFRMVGVQHIKPLDDEMPGDGSEIGGCFYNALDIWKRVQKFVPKKCDIPIIRLETHKATAIGKMMTAEQKRIARRLFPR
jgi:hypothetical protein